MGRSSARFSLVSAAVSNDDAAPELECCEVFEAYWILRKEQQHQSVSDQPRSGQLRQLYWKFGFSNKCQAGFDDDLRQDDSVPF